MGTTDETPSTPGSSPKPRTSASGRLVLLLSFAVIHMLLVTRLNALSMGPKQVDDQHKLNLLQAAGSKRVTSPANDPVTQETVLGEENWLEK